jgi:sialic acid synthase SpsE
MKTIKIDGRVIGHAQPTFVIAEIGVNHDGDVKKAIELTRMAANCGADAVKLQLFRASRLLHASSTFAEYQEEQRGSAETPADLLKKYELSTDDVRKIVQVARELRLIPLATPFSPGDMDVVEGLRLPAVKIASPDLVNQPLLRKVAGYGRPMIVSTGAASMDEVVTCADWLNEWGATYSFLHCISSYPTPAESANLCWIGELAARFDVPIGYSDHTTETVAGAFAVAAGATIVEKHFTYDRGARGPDHAASADPPQFERYVKQIREADRLRGVPGKKVLALEQDVRTVSRQSLVARRALQPGDVLREDDLTVQRPGTGMSAALIEQAVGRKASRAIAAGTLLQPDMLAEAA